MESLVYNLDEKIFSNEGLVNSIGYYNKEFLKEKYNQLIKEIYRNNKIVNDTELLNYLLSIDNAIQLERLIKIFSSDFIRKDKELFETIKSANLMPVALKCIIDYLSEILNSNINTTRKRSLILNSWIVIENHFIRFIIKNNKDIDDEMFEMLLNQAKKDWNASFEACCEQILKSDIVKDKKNMLEQLFNSYDSSRKTSEDILFTFKYIAEKEEIINSPKEMKKMLYLIKQSVQNSRLPNFYLRVFQNPEFCNDLKLRDYLFDVLDENLKSDHTGLIKYKIVFDACKNENVRNNEEHLNILKNTKSWEKCYLLSNVLQCEELTNNKELIDLILSMPNYYCLEQLLLAYEIEAINKDINILKQIAGLVPFADKMEDVRLYYGTNTNEMTWMARYDKFNEGKQRHRVLRYFKKD